MREGRNGPRRTDTPQGPARSARGPRQDRGGTPRSRGRTSQASRPQGSGRGGPSATPYTPPPRGSSPPRPRTEGPSGAATAPTVKAMAGGWLDPRPGPPD